MNGQIKKLKVSGNDFAYPITVAEAVYVEPNKTLTQKINEMTPGLLTVDSSGFFIERQNLHDLTQEVAGYISESDGGLVASETYTATPFISVLASTTYISSYAKNIATYDAGQVFLGMLSTTSENLTDFNYPRQFNIPSGVSYVRYTRGNANTYPMLVRGNVLPHEYLPAGTLQLWIPTNSHVQSMKLELNPLYGLKWHVLGDSITEGTYPDAQTGVAVINYHQALASQYGLNVTNYGVGGSRITASDDSQGFVQRYTAMSNDADIITVFGGINDYAWVSNTPIGIFGSVDTATIYGAMNVLCSGLLQKYPTKKLGFILPYGFNEYKGAGTWKPYEDAIVAVLEYYSIPYLNLRKESLLNANIDFINTAYFKQGDRTHPLTNGHAIIARKVYEFLKTL